MAALILLALGLTEKPPALKANNLSVPVEVSVHSALSRGVMGVCVWGGGGFERESPTTYGFTNGFTKYE